MKMPKEARAVLRHSGSKSFSKNEAIFFLYMLSRCDMGELSINEAIKRIRRRGFI